MPSLGEAILELRTRAGVSRSALARLSGIDVSILARLEYGERETIRFETLCRLAETLNVSLDELAARAGFIKRRSKKAAKADESINAKDALLRIAQIAQAAIADKRPLSLRAKR